MPILHGSILVATFLVCAMLGAEFASIWWSIPSGRNGLI